MGLADVQRRDVLQAIREYDTLGREAFLEKYGFGPATRYYLGYNGNRYDSKAIIGVAHGYIAPNYTPMGPGEFSGGEARVVSQLRKMGFTIEEDGSRPTRNPPWTDDELILALELYLKHGLLDDTSLEVINLSHELNRLGTGVSRNDPTRFRNPNGVALKLANLAALDPAYPGTGMTRGGRRDAVIWDRYSKDEDALVEAARLIRAGLPVEQADVESGAVTVVARDFGTIGTDPYVVQHRGGESLADRREMRLTEQFKEHLEGQGHQVRVHEYRGTGRPTFCDLFDESNGVLYEAKGTVSREAIRMAIGQLFDYRFLEDHPVELAVLLPRKPTKGLVRLLLSLNIAVVWQTSAGFDQRTPGPSGAT